MRHPDHCGLLANERDRMSEEFFIGRGESHEHDDVATSPLRLMHCQRGIFSAGPKHGGLPFPFQAIPRPHGAAVRFATSSFRH